MPSERKPTPRRPPPALTRALRSIGDDLAVWRKLRGMTQAQLADRAGVARTTLIRLEGGDGAVSLENVLRVARALGILEAISQAFDPYESDVGRLRSHEQLPQRVRPRVMRERDDG